MSQEIDLGLVDVVSEKTCPRMHIGFDICFQVAFLVSLG